MAAVPPVSRSEAIARRDQAEEEGEDENSEGQGTEGQGQPPLIRPGFVVGCGVVRGQALALGSRWCATIHLHQALAPGTGVDRLVVGVEAAPLAVALHVLPR